MMLLVNLHTSSLEKMDGANFLSKLPQTKCRIVLHTNLKALMHALTMHLLS